MWEAFLRLSAGRRLAHDGSPLRITFVEIRGHFDLYAVRSNRARRLFATIIDSLDTAFMQHARKEMKPNG